MIAQIPIKKFQAKKDFFWKNNNFMPVLGITVNLASISLKWISS